MTEPYLDLSQRRRQRMADVSVSEAAAAWADEAHVFVTRIDARQIEAVEQVGWRLEHIAEGTRAPIGTPPQPVFCILVRPSVS